MHALAYTKSRILSLYFQAGLINFNPILSCDRQVEAYRRCYEKVTVYSVRYSTTPCHVSRSRDTKQFQNGESGEQEERSSYYATYRVSSSQFSSFLSQPKLEGR
ncbi:hypothetical protein CBL_10416 [Carabus blaptoides fortunei]